MAEIAVLRTQIINYSKTRDVYTAYRKAGYSKKFLAEHEADILLYKAAKKAFDELGVQKLPRVKELQSEYAVLLAEKAFDRLMKDKTVLVIAHRLNTIEKADQILVMDGGRIREAGSHEQLMELNGWYAHAIQEQKKERREVLRNHR